MPDMERDHILVVEDDPDLREILSDALCLEGYEAVSAEHGQSALRYLMSGEKPSLILLDLMMPVMDGWTLLSELLKEPRLASIPVIIMTAAGQMQTKGIPSATVLYKPFQMDSLIEVVQKYCKGR